MKSADIIELLRKRHERDVLLTEVTCGKTLARMDVWVLEGYWTRGHTVICYEIKTSRSDFLQDTKWHTYLPYCHKFYFVAPAGVLDKREIPEAAGFIQVASTGSRLLTKKKAPRQNLDIPIEMWIRAIIRSSQRIPLDDWQLWLSDRQRGSLVGYEVSKKIAIAVEKRVGEIVAENLSLIAKYENTEFYKAQLEEAGLITEDGYLSKKARALLDGGTALPDHLVRRLKLAAEELISALTPEEGTD